MGLHRHWPLFDLVVRTPVLELRYVDDALAAELADLAALGIHDPATMPFYVPWTDVPPPLQQRHSLQHFWRGRAEITAQRWHLDLAVLVEGRVVGSAGLRAEHFARLRRVETGSWLGRAFQGRGLGTEVRRANLHLAFAGLGALEAASGAFTDNPASLAVSRKLGYEELPPEVTLRRETEVVGHVRFVLRRPRWEETLRSDGMSIEGLEPCRQLLGAVDRPG